MRINQKYRRRGRIILFLISLVWVAMYLSPVTYGFDENYTLALIHHSYTNMIHLDTLDVHPFLYYVLVKSFIKITTFYTNSPLMKVFSARCFSLCLSIGTFYFLHRIARLFKIYNHPVTEWILFLALPGVLNNHLMDNAQLTNLRMYPLMALLIVMEFYYLMKYWLHGRSGSLWIATAAMILAFYTHYYAMFLGGGLWLVYFVWSIIRHRHSQVKQLLIAGIAGMVLFLPWLPVLFQQAGNSSTYWMNSVQEHTEFINLFWVLIIFSCPVYRYQRRNSWFRDQLRILGGILVVTVLFTIVYALKVGDAFQCRYLFPLLLIYEFLGINLAWNYLVQHDQLIWRFVSLAIILLLFINSCQTFRGNNAFSRIRPLAVVDRPAVSVERLSPRVANDHRATIALITNLIYRHQRVIIPVRSKRTFQQHAHIYWNATYRQVFGNEIKRISYR